MQPSTYHQLLLGQIRQILGDTPDLPADFVTLLQQISDTYSQFDQDQKLVESKAALRTEQLIASTSRAYSFLDSLNMGFVMCDVNPEVVLANLPAKHILAAKLPGIAEWTLAAIDSALRPDLELRKLVVQSLETSQPQEYEAVNIGQRVVRLSIAPMVNESDGEKQQIGAVILMEDITEQKVLERSKDEFLSIASHELRTPLTAIRGNAALIKKYYAASITDPDMAEMVDDIHESSVRLISIVNDFLDVSALEQGKILMNPESFALNEVVQEVERELQNLCQSKSISLVRDPTVAAAPAVMADKQRVKQVVYNLVGNAIKFTDHGSITLSGRADDSFVYISVADTGRGMSAQSQHLLFRKFQQAGSSLLTRDTTKGTGLGLYISRLIVELSGGKIELEYSEAGQGSSFGFSLPRSS